MKKLQKLVVRCVFALLALASFGPSAKAATLVSDSFTLNSTARVAGARLDGMAPEQQTGSGVWRTNSAYTTFTSAGSISTATGGQNPVGEIAIGNVTAATTVQANVVTNTSQWMAVGFQSSVDPGNWFTTNSQLFVLLRPNGGLQLFDNNVHAVASASLTMNSTSPYLLALMYDPTAGTASVSVNGVSLISNQAVNVTSTVVSAGFFGNAVATANAASFDDFAVSTVPEPATGPRLVCGGLVLFGAFRVRRILRKEAHA